MAAIIAAVAYFLFGTTIVDPVSKAYLAEMKVGLRNLREAEESFRGDSSGTLVMLDPDSSLNPTLNPPTITATDSTWSATITSKRLPGSHLWNCGWGAEPGGCARSGGRARMCPACYRIAQGR